MRKTNLWGKMFLFLVPVMFVALPVAVIATESGDDSGDDNGSSASTTSTTTVSTGSIEEILKQIIALIEKMVESQKALVQTIKEDQKQQQRQQQFGQGGYGGYGGGGYGGGQGGGSNQQDKLLSSIIKQLLKEQTQPRDPFAGTPWANQGGLPGQGGGNFPYDQSAIDRLRRIPGVTDVSVVGSGASNSDDPLGGILDGIAPWRRPGAETGATGGNFTGMITRVGKCYPTRALCELAKTTPSATALASLVKESYLLTITPKTGVGIPLKAVAVVKGGEVTSFTGLVNAYNYTTAFVPPAYSLVMNKAVLGDYEAVGTEPCVPLYMLPVPKCEDSGIPLLNRIIKIQISMTQ